MTGWRENYVYPLPNGEIVAIYDDVTPQKQAEEALRQSEAKFSALFNLAPGPVALTRLKDGVVLEANSSFLEFFGYQADEVIGHSTLPGGLGFWISNADRERWVRQLDGDAPSAGQEVYLFHKDRSLRVVSIAGRLLEIGGEKLILCHFYDVTERKQFEEKIWHQANYDLLTQLPNRRLFEDRLTQAMKKAQREGQPLALLFIDLDGFKTVNDTLGHDLGDVLLMEAAQRISGCVREMDTVARLGGDEFTVILPVMTDTARVIQRAEAIVQALDAPFDLAGETVSISASVGIAVYPKDGGDVETLLKSADQALYAVKHHGKHGYRFFNESPV
jgi:diguanylate cyclase (GGDEF)-like protein/PAS domain S-box-containing protein